ncbi:MAG: HAD-IC family P-type ATPase [Bacilli bacterium]|nr:HAD-IC family P-type ATPase [Bacilli bacterium]
MMEKWYNLKIEDVFSKVNSNEVGLSNKESKKRLEKHGKNELPKKKKDSVFKIFFRQMLDPIVILLIVTVVFSLIINEVIDAIAILFIVLVDLIIGTYQEWKAEKTAESLSNLIKVKCKVLRDQKEIEIDSSELVVGDIVLLESGNKISADLRIIECHNLQIDESILTGESVNIVKTNKIMPENSSLGDRKNMAYAGTAVVTGRAKAIVVETGINTEIGKIANKVSNTKETKSPLTIRMEKFSKQISMLVVVVAIIIAVVLIYKDVPGSEIFLSVIALSVSAMPEGLPLALTMALTIASNRMAKKNVVVKKLNSVESLGSCTVIASDKTGTLTVNEQTAKKILLPDNSEYDVEGTGYTDKGSIIPLNNSNIERAKYISFLGAINNEAFFEKKGKIYNMYGDSIDIAFLALGMKADVDKSSVEVVGTIPYESENKYSAVFYKKDNDYYCTVKGSLEKVMEFCKKMNINGKNVKIDEELLKNQNEGLAKDGYRVIALANAKIKGFEQKEYYDDKDINNLIFEGMVAFIDPIREEAKTSIDDCHTAGIKVVMITGDHPLTAFKIAKDLNLVESYDEITTGVEVEEYLHKGQKEFDEFVATKKVFTRVTPIDKLEIVEAYKRMGEFVAVTGDGVNDAPAIRSANIGIAMGSGTDTAKETASMIIIDDNFKSIVAGIKEGRGAYSNIRKVSYLLLSCGFAEVLFFLLSIMFDLPMPLVAIQLLWLNIVTDGLQDLALSFEKPDKDIMKEKPRDTKESIFNKKLLQEVLLSGITMGLVVFCVWIYLIKGLGYHESVARGYIVMLMVFMQNMHVLNCRSEDKPFYKVSFRTNPFVIFSIVSAIVLQIIFAEVDVLSQFLQTSSIPVIHLVYLFITSSIILVVVEIYKHLRFGQEKTHE